MEFISIGFYKLLQMTVIASVIAITIIIIKKVLFKQISPKILYLMWGIFLISLVIPPFIESKTSIYNYIDISVYENEIQENNFNNEILKTNTEDTISNNLKENSDNLEKNFIDLENLKSLLNFMLPLLWIIGVIVFATIYIISNIIFKIKVGREEFNCDRIENIFKTTKEKIKVKNNIKLINQKIVFTPAIVGIFNPKILLTDNLKQYSDFEIEYIFRHELAHYKRRDNFINCLLILLRTIHWFNPVIWFAIKEIRKDMEYIADETAVKGLEEKDKKEYCRLLVNLAANIKPSFMEKAIGITDDKNNLEKRIDMIKLSDKISKHPIFATTLVFVIIGLICLILYTNKYYVPELEEPPVLYLKNSKGTAVPMELVEYSWLYKDELKTYDAKFNQETFEFKKENTTYDTVHNIYEDSQACYSVFTEPKYRMSFIRVKEFKNIKGTNYYSYGSEIVYGENGTEIQKISISNDIIKIIVHFPNGSRATYVAKCQCFDFCSEDVFERYKNTNLDNKEKITELVKELSAISLLDNIEIQDKTLNINYKYAQKQMVSYDMSLVLFETIPELEKVVITTNHTKVGDYTNNGEVISFDYSPLEITRDNVSDKASKTIEELKTILNER